MNTVETFKPHAAEIRKRICDALGALGLAVLALENCELSAATDGVPDEAAASAPIMVRHLEEMLSMLESVGYHAANAGDVGSAVILRLGNTRGGDQAAATDDEADNGASHRVRRQGGAS